MVQGLTTTDDEDRLVPAVRLIRPEKRTVAPLKAYEESAWEAVDEAVLARGLGRRGGRRPIPGIRASWCWSRACCCRSGAACPSKATIVRRLKAPDGRRWLGRVLDPGQVPG